MHKSLKRAVERHQPRDYVVVCHENSTGREYALGNRPGGLPFGHTEADAHETANYKNTKPLYDEKYRCTYRVVHRNDWHGEVA